MSYDESLIKQKNPLETLYDRAFNEGYELACKHMMEHLQRLERCIKEKETTK